MLSSFKQPVGRLGLGKTIELGYLCAGTLFSSCMRLTFEWERQKFDSLAAEPYEQNAVDEVDRNQIFISQVISSWNHEPSNFISPKMTSVPAWHSTRKRRGGC